MWERKNVILSLAAPRTRTTVACVLNPSSGWLDWVLWRRKGVHCIYNNRQNESIVSKWNVAQYHLVFIIVGSQTPNWKWIALTSSWVMHKVAAWVPCSQDPRDNLPRTSELISSTYREWDWKKSKDEKKEDGGVEGRAEVSSALGPACLISHWNLLILEYVFEMNEI